MRRAGSPALHLSTPAVPPVVEPRWEEFKDQQLRKKVRHNQTLQRYMRSRLCVCTCVHLLYFPFFFSTTARLSISSEDSCLYLYQEIIRIISSIAWAAVQRAACCYPSLLSGVWDSWAARLERWGSFRALGCTRSREIISCAANLSLQERWFSPL